MPDEGRPISGARRIVQELLTELQLPLGDAVAKNLAVAVGPEMHAYAESRSRVFGGSGDEQTRCGDPFQKRSNVRRLIHDSRQDAIETRCLLVDRLIELDDIGGRDLGAGACVQKLR